MANKIIDRDELPPPGDDIFVDDFTETPYPIYLHPKKGDPKTLLRQAYALTVCHLAPYDIH